MLKQKQIQEIRDHLDKAQNPLFFFDNDGDGLCSFLLLQRYIGRGKGVSIKSFPELSVDYFRKVRELNADYIFILDKALVSDEFLKEAEQINIPIVWIDHHLDEKNIPNFVNYYNPILTNSKEAEAVAAFCYQVSQKKEDMWLAITGCISDGFLPDYYPDFQKQNPDLAIDSKDALEIYYSSELGKIVRMFNLALMDKTSNVINMLRYLMKAKSPYDVLEENSKNYSMHKRFNEINAKFNKLVDKAKNFASSRKLLYFQYSGTLSISSELSNKLCYLYPKKIIVTAFITGGKVNISGRGEGVKKILLKAIDGFENATGGGHDVAVGAKIMVDNLEEFKKRLGELVK